MRDVSPVGEYASWIVAGWVGAVVGSVGAVVGTVGIVVGTVGAEEGTEEDSEDGELNSTVGCPLFSWEQAQSSKTTTNSADSKYFFFTGPQPFTRLGKYLPSVYIINKGKLSSQQHNHYSLYTKRNKQGRAVWHAPVFSIIHQESFTTVSPVLRI